MSNLQEPIYNFAWGSHLHLAQYVKILGSEPISRTRASLKDHRLTASELKTFPDEQAILAGDGGGPRFISSDGEILYGVLYQISAEQWEILDSYEREWGFDAFVYEVITDEGQQIRAHVHNLVDHGDFKAPSDEFVSTMERGLEELNYDSEIIEIVVSQLTTPLK